MPDLTPSDYARIYALAWIDPTFCAALRLDPYAAIKTELEKPWPTAVPAAEGQNRLRLSGGPGETGYTYPMPMRPVDWDDDQLQQILDDDTGTAGFPGYYMPVARSS